MNVCCRLNFTPTEKEMRDVEKRFSMDSSGRHLTIPENFTQTVPSFGDGRRTDCSAGILETSYLLTMHFSPYI